MPMASLACLTAPSGVGRPASRRRVCSIHASAGVAVRESAEPAAQLASEFQSSGLSPAAQRAEPRLSGAAEAASLHGGEEGNQRSSPWLQRSSELSVDARLRQASVQRRAASRRDGAALALDPHSRRSRPADAAEAPSPAAQRQQPQRQRRQAANLQRSPSRSSRSSNSSSAANGSKLASARRGTNGQVPLLQAAVRSNRKHDWQVTRDWLLMEMGDAHLDDDMFSEIADATGLPDICRPQVSYCHELGLTKSDMVRLAETREQLFHLSLPTMKAKLKFLQEEAGLSSDDLRKMLIKFPRVLEYKTERTLRPRLDFLKRHGILQGDIAKVVLRAPATLELSVEDSLEPRVAFLQQVAGVPQDSIAKVLLRVPSLLTCTESSMQQRIDFLHSAGFDDAQLAKAIVAHPQILYYRVDSMAAKVQYLRSIGVGGEQMATVVTRLPQLLSLDIANNMAPKFEYLRSELGGTVNTIAGYPAYFSLSLPQRIMPRHRFLQVVHSQRTWPFPMQYLKVSDERFATDIAKTPLEKFEAFKKTLPPPRSRKMALHRR